MGAQRLLRAVYARASDFALLRRPLDAVRGQPAVRALARRHVGVLLGEGRSWANVEGALRLLAEDERARIVFGPWTADTETELLYWAPFVRWANARFGLDPARLVVLSRGDVAAWYAGACGRYVELLDHLDEGVLDGLDGGRLTEAVRTLRGATIFRPEPVLELVRRYRSGTDAPRPLLKRAVHARLEAAPDPVTDGLPDGYLAVSLAPAPALPDSAGGRSRLAELLRRLAPERPVVRLDAEGGGSQLDPLGAVPPQRRRRAQHALVARATGVIAPYSGLAVLGALSGTPTLAVRSRAGRLCEPDVDLALRAVAGLGGSLAILDVDDLDSLAAVLGHAVPPAAGGRVSCSEPGHRA